MQQRSGLFTTVQPSTTIHNPYHTLRTSSRGIVHATAHTTLQLVHPPGPLCSMPLSHHPFHHAKHHPHPYPTDPRGSPSWCIPQTKVDFHHFNRIADITLTSRPSSSIHLCHLSTPFTSCTGRVVCTSMRCPQPSSPLIRRLRNWPNLTG